MAQTFRQETDKVQTKIDKVQTKIDKVQIRIDKVQTKIDKVQIEYILFTFQMNRYDLQLFKNSLSYLLLTRQK